MGSRPRRSPFAGAHFRTTITARGFTAVELMNLVTILLLLAVVGMVVLATYKRKARAAEAVQTLTVLGKAAAQYYNESDPVRPILRQFPPSSRASVPASMESVRGKRYRSAAADWYGPPWEDLHFSIREPQSYAYAFASQGAGAQARATATAKGDLDGDGNDGSFSLTIAPDEALTAKLGPIDKTNPEE